MTSTMHCFCCSRGGPKISGRSLKIVTSVDPSFNAPSIIEAERGGHLGSSLRKSVAFSSSAAFSVRCTASAVFTSIPSILKNSSADAGRGRISFSVTHAPCTFHLRFSPPYTQYSGPVYSTKEASRQSVIPYHSSPAWPVESLEGIQHLVRRVSMIMQVSLSMPATLGAGSISCSQIAIVMLQTRMTITQSSSTHVVLHAISAKPCSTN